MNKIDILNLKEWCILKIMISPAKNMKINNDFFDYESLPLFTNEADKLYALLSKLGNT